MVRPCFLVIDREYPGSISTRKLLLETAKYNVITAYSPQEAVETLRAFPKLSGVVMDSNPVGQSCEGLVKELRKVVSEIAVIVIDGPGGTHCGSVTHFLHTYTPKGLLDAVAKVTPQGAAELVRREQDLSQEFTDGAAEETPLHPKQ